ncbi:hypothetical protein AB5N19_00569 [Seiridium cardinale]
MAIFKFATMALALAATAWAKPLTSRHQPVLWSKAGCQYPVIQQGPYITELRAHCPGADSNSLKMCSALDLNDCFLNYGGKLVPQNGARAFDTCDRCKFAQRDGNFDYSVMVCSCRTGPSNADVTTEVSLGLPAYAA